MELALKSISIENESNPVKINGIAEYSAIPFLLCFIFTIQCSNVYLYPQQSFFRTSFETSRLSVTTAVPVSWLTIASSTSGISFRALFNGCLAVTAHHSVNFHSFFLYLFSPYFLCFLNEFFLSFLGLYILNQFNLSALVTTQKLDKLIAAAPNIGLSCQFSKL